MKILTAIEVNGSVQLDVHIDDGKLIRDPEAPLPDEGEKDTRSLVPDPEFVMSVQWGADVPVETIKRETALLCDTELARRLPGHSVAGLDGVTLTNEKKTAI